MLRMNVAYYSKAHSSEFIARQAFIAQSASCALNLLITTLSRDALTIVGLVSSWCRRTRLLSVLALMFVPSLRSAYARSGSGCDGSCPRNSQGVMQMMESLQETAQGIRIVKAFTLEDFMRKRQGAAIRGFQTAANKLASVSSRTSPIMESLGGFAIAAVVLYSGYTVIIRGNQPGSLFSFITSVIMLYEPMKRVARFHVDMSTSLLRRRHAIRFPRRARIRGRSSGGGRTRDYGGPDRVSRCGVRLSSGRAGPPCRKLRRGSRENDRVGRTIGRRQVDSDGPDPAALRHRSG